VFGRERCRGTAAREHNVVRKVLHDLDARLPESVQQFRQPCKCGILNVVQNYDGPVLMPDVRKTALDPMLRVVPVVRHTVPQHEGLTVFEQIRKRVFT
jgi:hypothetical protein